MAFSPATLAQYVATAEIAKPVPITPLDPSYAAELLRRADRLQSEAAAVIQKLDLVTLLGRLGHVEQLDSSVTGLMV